MIVLGIESSCDESAIALVRDDKTILGEQLLSHLTLNRKFGGVIPEVTARSHLTALPPLLQQIMAASALALPDIDAIAATAGPGLIGGVLVGAMMAKGLALSLGKPFLAINHLEAHILTPRLVHPLPFPYLSLLVSGGHCQFVEVKDLGAYEVLGTTRDDALGEAFDKVGKMMGLAYPAGPEIEKLALAGDKHRFLFPMPLCQQKSCDFSFSGLKTAVRKAIETLPPLTVQDKCDIAASFQQTVIRVLQNRIGHLLHHEKWQRSPRPSHFVLTGGVAANQAITHAIQAQLNNSGLTLYIVPPKLCTDNAAMVGWAGIEYMKKGRTSSFDFAPRPRWPLEEISY